MTAPYTGEDRRLIQRAGDEATERVWADRRMQEQLAKVTAERDEAIVALRKICRVDYRVGLKGLVRPTEFAESEARGMALGNVTEIARKALKKLGGAA